MLKSILKSTFVFTCAVLLVAAQIFSPTVGLESDVSALESGDIVMQIKPAEQELELAPGTTTVGSLKVQNIGRLGFTVRMSVRPYQVTNEEYDPDFYTENSYTLLKNWITFNEPEFYLEAGQEKEVFYTVKVPNDISGGGQYAAIIVETRDGMDPNATFRVVSQLVSLIFAHVSGEEHVGGVLMSHSLPGFILGSDFSSSATIKNDGNVDFRATQTLTIYDFFRNTVVFSPDYTDANGKTPARATPIILPETSRSSRLTWEGAPQLGVFRAVQTISFLDEEYTFEQIVFICPLWLAGVVVFIVVLMLFWVILRIRHRKRNRPQAF